MARNAGLAAVLVLSGITTRQDLDGLPVQPDIVLKGVSEIAHVLA